MFSVHFFYKNIIYIHEFSQFFNNKCFYMCKGDRNTVELYSGRF